MDVELQKYAVIELKYDEGKVFTVRRKWILHQKQQYNKTDDVFCYWSNDLEASSEEMMKYEYSKKFTGEPALFKVFVVKLADSLAEAEQYIQGRLKSVPKKFREPGNTDEEIKKMQSNRRKSAKKELRSHQAQAQALNMGYLIDQVKVQLPCASSSLNTENDNISGDEEIVVPPKPKKIKENRPLVHSMKVKHTKRNGEAPKDELLRGPVMVTENLINKTLQLSASSPTNNSNAMEFSMSDDLIYGQGKEPNDENHSLEQSPSKTRNEPGTYQMVQNIQLHENVVHNTLSISTSTKDSITMYNFQSVPDEHVSNEEKRDGTTKLSNSSEFNCFPNQLTTLCEIPSPPLGIELSGLYSPIMNDSFNEYPNYDQAEENISQTSEEHVLQTQLILSETRSGMESVVLPEPNDSQVDDNDPTKQVEPCYSESSIVVLNFDELTRKYNDAVAEATKLKSENESLKTELSKSNRRNKLLQDYLVAADERVPEILFVEKDGGRLYRDDIFLTKKQCAVLDKAKSDNEYINNLLVCIFGREVLTTHTLSGKRGKNKKELSGQTSEPAQLDRRRLSLIYDIMDARAFANKTKKLTKTEINAVITKKISNLTTYAEKSLKIQEN